MYVWADILSFAVFTGFAFVALCAITRVGRGWRLQFLGLGAFLGVDALMEWWWLAAKVSEDWWLAVLFVSNWTLFAALVFCFSRDSFGRRLFLSITYGAYAVCYAAVFHLFAYRNVFGLSSVGNIVVGFAALGAVAAMNLAFVFWVLPQMPRDSRNFCWRDSCVAAGVMFCGLFASGFWPVSIVSSPARYCVPFALASVAAWVAFPILCRSMRDRQRNVDVEHSLDLMMAEVKARRAAIDLARRLRHDQRHHHAQIAEYMRSGQYEKAIAYLRELDAESQETPTERLVWCGNETINAILSGASRKAAAKGVGFDAKISVEQTIALPDVELVAVAANLIENAINASERAGEVSVVLRQRAFGLGVTVTNSVPDGFALSDSGLPCAEPGIGLESVRRVVERHGGQWTYELKDGSLKCQVILMTA